MGIDEAVGPPELKLTSDGKAKPDQLTDDLEATGPTYVKLGHMLCFLAAAAGGFSLVISIFAQDQKGRKKPPQ